MHVTKVRSVASKFSPANKGRIYYERARSELLLINTKNMNMRICMSGRQWPHFSEGYISGSVSPIDKRSPLLGKPIPPAVYGTNAESCQYLLWQLARGACCRNGVAILCHLPNYLHPKRSRPPREGLDKVSPPSSSPPPSRQRGLN